MEPKAVNLKEAAKAIGVHPHTLKALIADGRIHVVRVGRRYLVPVSELERFLEPAEQSA
jgi:excisionase family DNA binding protein